MSTPFMGEIRLFSFNFAPQGWARCNGQFLPINQNQALFSLLGTRYGGNGQTTFALPDMRDRAAMHQGNVHTIGERGGEAAHTLSISELPTHTHVFNASTTVANTTAPTTSNVISASTPQFTWGSPNNFTAMAPQAISNIGGSQAHENRQPFAVTNFSISLSGLFPSQD
jgi:microcystin-dependent protein